MKMTILGLCRSDNFSPLRVIKILKKIESIKLDYAKSSEILNLKN